MVTEARVEPFPLETRAAYRVLAWPRYDRADELDALLAEFGRVTQRHRRDLALVLRYDPRHDPPLAKAQRALTKARRRVFGFRGRCEHLLLDAELADAELARLGAAVQWMARLDSSTEPERTAFHLAVGAAQVGDGQELETALFEARAVDDPIDVYGEERQVPVRLRGREITLHYPHTPGILPYLQEILQGREYPLFLEGRYAPRTVVDVGGHIGTTAMHFAAAYPEASVYTFEPSARSFAFLERNVAQYENVRAFPFGLFDRDHEIAMHHGATSSMENSVVVSATTGEDTETVRLRKASAVLEELAVETVSILKVDTEGCELPILAELAPWLASTDFLHLEYHSEGDRRAIEERLGEAFQLCAARADSLHRGSNVYLARRLVEEYPELDEPEIRLEL